MVREPKSLKKDMVIPREDLHDGFIRENLNALINDLVNTTISFSELSKKYNIGITTVHNINKGRTRKKDNLLYPLRK